MATTALVLLFSPIAVSEDRVAAKPSHDRPILVASFASFDRFLNLSDGALKLADRAELAIAMRGAIALSTAGLKGIDRKRPFGLMTCIDKNDLPDPVAVYYLPIKDRDQFAALLKTVAAAKPLKHGKLSLLKVRIAESDWVVRFVKNYAFFAVNARSLDRRLIDPATEFKSLSRSDLAIRFQIGAMPKLMKSMLLDYLRARVANDAPRRRGESEVDHRYRTVIADSTLAVLGSVLRDGRSVSFGLTAGKGNRSATIVATLQPKSGTKLGRQLKTLTASRNANIRRPSGGSWLRLNITPDRSWQPILEMLLRDVLQSNRTTKPIGDSARQLATLGWSGGLQLLLWQPGETRAIRPRLIASAKINENSAAAVDKLFKALKDGGRIASVKKETDARNKMTWYRFRWRSAKSETANAGILGMNTRVAWLATGNGDLKAVVLKQIELDRRHASKKNLAGGDTLLSGSLRLSSFATDAKLPAKDDGIRFEAKNQDGTIRLTTTLESGVVAGWLKRVFSTAARRIPALRR